MAYLLTHMSAADFWRRVYSPHKAPSGYATHVPLAEASSNARELAKSLPRWADGNFTQLEGGTFHLLVGARSKRWHSKLITPHLWLAALPDGSFYQLNDDVYVASPEFAFLHLAQTLSLTQLIAYGYEICGRYAFDPNAERGFRTRAVPLTSVAKLQRFLLLAGSCRGVDQAVRALEYVGDNSESPMETLVAMLLHLPYRHGGYGLESPEANVTIELSRAACLIARQKRCRIDMQWEQSKTAVEFLGKHDHDNEASFERDRQRTNALTEMGYCVIELTAKQVRDWAAFEAIALRIARRTGKRVTPRNRGLTEARSRLREVLYAWNSAFGHAAL